MYPLIQRATLVTGVEVPPTRALLAAKRQHKRNFVFRVARIETVTSCKLVVPKEWVWQVVNPEFSTISMTDNWGNFHNGSAKIFRPKRQ
jgi:hypothetical protein